MKEILFRGKRINNGEWVYGQYIKACIHWHRYGKHEDWIACGAIQNGGMMNLWGRYAVIPETVGQFTGLCDKNGRKIFEGDIVKNPHGIQGVVEWKNAECAFLVNTCDDWETIDNLSCEVIDNIYDYFGK